MQLSDLKRLLLKASWAPLLFIVAACSGGGGGGGDSPPPTSGSNSPPPAPAAGAIAFQSANQSVAQNAGTVTVNVNRSQGVDGAVSVSYATAAGTAVAGTDFTATSGTLTWAANESASKSVTVPISNATPFSGSKSFTIALSGATGGATIGSPATTTVAINGSGSDGGGGTTGSDKFSLSAASYSIAQTGGSISIVVNRSEGSDEAASVAYATGNGTATAGTHYTATSGNLNWAAGGGGVKSFSVPISNASPFSGTKTFSVTLSTATGATLGTPVTATVTITGSQTPGGTSPAATLAAKLGKPSRLLIGTGGGAEVPDILNQGLRPDIYDRYLVGVGAGDWTTWNSPKGAYVGIVAAAADSVGAVPMFTLYQMAQLGDGNLAGINDSSFMTGYWANVKLMFQQIAVYGKPAIVNFEPDFWGYVQRQASGGDPTKMPAKVTIASDCAGLSNDVVGVAGCMLKLARTYAPNAYVGFPPSTWGADSTAQLTTFMNKLGSANADFIVMQTSDRDAGCFEVVPQPSQCVRTGSPWYWDASNQTHPNFHDHFAMVDTYRKAVGNLPVIWWQTPMGVASSTRAGTDKHYRDNRVQYFLTHPAEITAVGGLGVVFSTGHTSQTNVTTDGGQFQNLSLQYLANPQPLP